MKVLTTHVKQCTNKMVIVSSKIDDLTVVLMMHFSVNFTLPNRVLGFTSKSIQDISEEIVDAFVAYSKIRGLPSNSEPREPAFLTGFLHVLNPGMGEFDRKAITPLFERFSWSFKELSL